MGPRHPHFHRFRHFGHHGRRYAPFQFQWLAAQTRRLGLRLFLSNTTWVWFIVGFGVCSLIKFAPEQHLADGESYLRSWKTMKDAEEGGKVRDACSARLAWRWSGRYVILGYQKNGFSTYATYRCHRKGVSDPFSETTAYPRV